MKAPDLARDALWLGPLAPRLIACGLAAGALGIGAGGVAGFGDRAGLAHAWLLDACFVLTLVLGALAFVLIQHLARAGWSVVVRRLAEGVAMGAPLCALLLLPLLLVLPDLYPWADPAVVAHSPILQAKRGWLAVPFFSARLVAYLAVWIGLALYLFRRSTGQDGTKDPAATLALQRMSAPGMALFALSATFAAFDLLMSLQPEWSSTIFGVYVFAGSLVAFLALLALATRALQAAGRIRLAVTPEHSHDLGKLLFGFSVFWAYIAFSQYMLIWYANLPEETSFYRIRLAGGWEHVSLALLLGHFVVPFFVLISRHPKRRPGWLALAAAWLLAMHWLDLFWLVKPALSPERATVSVPDLAFAAGMLGLLLAAVVLVLRRHPLVPVGDPRLAESLSFENV